MDTPAPRDDFLARLPTAAAEELHRLGARRRFPAGSVIFLEGDPAHELLVLLDGQLKLSADSSDGREVVLDVFGPGMVVGELSVIDARPRSATVGALSAVEVLSISAVEFNAFLDRHPAVLRLLLIDVIDRLRTRVRHQMEFGARDALGRVCARLTELADRYGEPEGDRILLRCPVTQSDLAAWTGLSREAVVKALATLRRLGWAQNQGADYTINDLERMRSRAAN